MNKTFLVVIRNTYLLYILIYTISEICLMAKQASNTQNVLKCKNVFEKYFAQHSFENQQESEILSTVVLILSNILVIVTKFN